MPRTGGSRSERLAFALVAALAVALAAHRMEDFDVWYHLAAGRLMWATGRWPATNTFAYTAADHPWVDLHWLFQLVLYGAYQLAGINGCIALAAGLLVATVAVLHGLACRFVRPVPAAVLLAAALAVASSRFVPRPELISFLLFALYLTLLEGHPGNGRAIWLLVPLQAIWTNVQGIFAVGIALIACYWIGATLAFLPVPRGWQAANRIAPAAWRRLGAVLLLATAACLVNPYGLAGALFPFELLPRVTGGSFLSQRIGEFRGPFESGYAPPLTIAWAALLACAGVLTLLNARRWHLGRTLALLAFGVLSTRSMRNMAFAAWIAVPVIAANFAGALETLGLRRTAAGELRARRALEWAGLCAIVLLIGAVVSNRFSHALGVEREFGLGVSRVRFPVEAIDFLRRAGIAGRPFNCLAMGGFLAWHRHPEEQIYVDGRLEAFPDDVLRTYFGVMDDPRGWPSLAQADGFDYAFLFHLWGNRLPLAVFLAGGRGWQLVYYDAIASIFVPADEAHREMRERALRTFAEMAPQRDELDGAGASPSWLSVPITEIWRARALGAFLLAMGERPRAIRAYERAVALDPGESDTRYTLGLAYWYAGQRSEAVREWREVVRRDPEHAAAAGALGQAQR